MWQAAVAGLRAPRPRGARPDDRHVVPRRCRHRARHRALAALVLARPPLAAHDADRRPRIERHNRARVRRARGARPTSSSFWSMGGLSLSLLGWRAAPALAVVHDLWPRLRAEGRPLRSGGDAATCRRALWVSEFIARAGGRGEVRPVGLRRARCSAPAPPRAAWSGRLLLPGPHRPAQGPPDRAARRSARRLRRRRRAATPGSTRELRARRRRAARPARARRRSRGEYAARRRRAVPGRVGRAVGPRAARGDGGRAAGGRDGHAAAAASTCATRRTACSSPPATRGAARGGRAARRRPRAARAAARGRLRDGARAHARAVRRARGRRARGIRFAPMSGATRAGTTRSSSRPAR